MATKDMKDSKAAALETAIAQIEKQCGKGSIMRLGDNTRMGVTGVTTGSISLDIALGIGGVPRGRIIEIYGPESSGKTTIALHIVAEVQKLGGEAAFIDAEHALDPVYAKALGVDIDKLLVSQPDDGEQALEITEALVRSGAIEVVVIDSVAALVPRNELDGDMGASHVGLHARLMSQALRQLSGSISKSNMTVANVKKLFSKAKTVCKSGTAMSVMCNCLFPKFLSHSFFSYNSFQSVKPKIRSPPIICQRVILSPRTNTEIKTATNGSI
jgi:recombination protein RecA